MGLLGGAFLPPLPYLVGLVVASALVGGLFLRRSPEISERVVLALVPWMLVGAGLRTLPQVGATPEPLTPLFGTVSVYLTTFVLAGGLWLLVDAAVDPPLDVRLLGGTGLVALVGVVAGAIAGGQTFRPGISLGALVATVAVTAVAWSVLGRFDPEVREVLPRIGPLVVFAHALDGVSTAVGVDLLGFGERTPTSRFVLEFAAQLPTADLIGSGWLFLVLKLALATVIVHLFVEFVREDPQWGNLLLGATAAVGLGPGAHNLLLYAVAAG